MKKKVLKVYNIITNENLFNEMAKGVLSPAQMKHKHLIQKYLNYKP